MTSLRIGGVPEHFNLPFHLAIEKNLFAQAGIDLKWIMYPEGTGAMNKALRNWDIDMAVILTGGIIRDIANGNPSKIIQGYVSSPLLWGIHVAASSNFQNERDLEGARVAISRFGSGSHVMAYAHAQSRDWDTKKIDFVEVKTLENAVKALTAEDADYFMWEHFTTKPLVDDGTFRLINDFPSPWSSFVIAASDKAIAENSKTLRKVLDVINGQTTGFKEVQDIDKILAERYNQKIGDIRKWLSHTSWSQKQVNNKEVENVQRQLQKLHLIDKKLNFNEVIVRI